MSTAFSRHLPVQGTYNVRDLGGYLAAGGETRWRRILRADGLHRLDDAGIEALISAGVTTVIDLRHASELESHPNPVSGHPGVAYHNVSLFEQLAPPSADSQNVLLDLYKQALDSRGHAIAEVLTIIADAPPGAVLFHCTAGKDRTGIISALLLAIAGVEATLIVEDYALTASMIAPMIEEMVANAVSRGMDDTAFRRLLGAEPETMLATIAYLEATYGAAARYLDLIGLPTATVDRLRQRLLGDI